MGSSLKKISWEFQSIAPFLSIFREKKYVESLLCMRQCGKVLVEMFLETCRPSLNLSGETPDGIPFPSVFGFLLLSPFFKNKTKQLFYLVKHSHKIQVVNFQKKKSINFTRKIYSVSRPSVFRVKYTLS